MTLTVDQLHKISGNKRYAKRKKDFADFVNNTAARCSNLGRLPDQAQFLAQLMHESGGFRHTKEIWGSTKAQRQYEGRKDLGNVKKGDGKRFMGRDYIQCTGRYNYQKLTKWMRARYPDCPDFEENPDALLDPKWLGSSALWYWVTRVDQKYVDEGNIEMITRQINGGLNGFQDRLRYYERAALVLLGYSPSDIRAFQKDNGLKVDGISGALTRKALHEALQKAEKTRHEKTPRYTTNPDPKGISPAEYPAHNPQSSGFSFGKIIGSIISALTGRKK